MREIPRRTGERSVWVWLIRLMAVGTFLVIVKTIFVNYNIDSEYALAMSYRMLQGDHMFSQMWEPHQTSAFLCTFFMWLYYSLTETWTGVVVYLHIIGAVICLGVSWGLYRSLRRVTEKHVAVCICCYYLAARPKDMLFPEFSNMQIWFSTLLFIYLAAFLERQTHIFCLMLASVFLCLEIISYPSCILVFPIILFLLILYTQKKWRNVFLFSMCCAVQGAAYLCFFWLRMGDSFLKNIRNIIRGDEMHGIKMWQSVLKHCFGGADKVILLLAASLMLGTLLGWFLYRRRKKNVFCIQKKMDRIVWFFLLFFLLASVCAVVAPDNRTYVGIYPALFGVAIMNLKVCGMETRRRVVTGLAISGGSFLATIFLTNLGIFPTLKYCVLGVTVSLIPICESLKKTCVSERSRIYHVFPLLFCLTFIFQRGMLASMITYDQGNLFDLGNIVRSGPAVGMVSDYMGVYILNSTEEEWKQFVRPGDRVLLVGEPTVSTLAYLYEDVQVSAPSTICTPTYNEQMLEYWKENPEKYPNVVVVDCWYGELRVPEDSWIMQWIQQEYKPSTYVDGKYRRYYYRDEPSIMSDTGMMDVGSTFY